jgi:hypothetical protein
MLSRIRHYYRAPLCIFEHSIISQSGIRFLVTNIMNKTLITQPIKYYSMLDRIKPHSSVNEFSRR